MVSTGGTDRWSPGSRWCLNVPLPECFPSARRSLNDVYIGIVLRVSEMPTLLPSLGFGRLCQNCLFCDVAVFSSSVQYFALFPSLTTEEMRDFFLFPIRWNTSCHDSYGFGC